MSVVRCRVLKNFSHDQINLTPIRIALYNDCRFTSDLVLNSVISGLKRPVILTYHDLILSGSDGNWTGVHGDLIHNRSDICANFNSANPFRFNLMHFSPLIGYSNRISILSGEISDNSFKIFNVFESFPIELWTIYGSLLIVVAIICDLIHLNSYPSLVRIVDNYFALIMQFLSQSQKYFRNICCIKHIVMNTTTLISITLMTLFFITQLSSNLIHNPILHIDSMDDLAQFITNHPHVKLVADNTTTSWPFIINWPGEHGDLIRKKLTTVPTLKYDYSDVYNGQTMIIGLDFTIEDMMIVNSNLKFHLSRDRHYGTPLGLFYSKSIDTDLKYKLDSICKALFESGMLNSYKELRTRNKRLNIVDVGYTDENISKDFIVTRIGFFIVCFISLILLLLIEMISSKIRFIRQLWRVEIEIQTPFSRSS